MPIAVMVVGIDILASLSALKDPERLFTGSPLEVTTAPEHQFSVFRAARVGIGRAVAKPVTGVPRRTAVDGFRLPSTHPTALIGFTESPRP